MAGDGTLYVTESGDVTTYGDAQEALISGASALTSEESAAYRAEQARRAQLEEEYGGVTGAGVTLATSALSGASLGISDLAADGLGLDDELRAYREINPGSNIAGQIGGSLLGLGKFAAAFRGASLLGRGARALLRGASAPTRALYRGGAALERGLLGAGRSRLLSGVAREGFEGLGQGVGYAISESAIQDRELTAELLASEGLRGAVLGGATGGALGVLGAGVRTSGRTAQRLAGMLRRPTAEGLDGVADAAAGSGSLLDSVVDAGDAVSSRLSGTERGAIRELLRDAGDGELLARKAMRAEDIAREQVEGFTGELSKVQSTLQRLENLSSGALKESNVRKLVRTGNEVATTRTAEEVVERLKDTLAAIRADRGRYGQAPGIKNLEAMADKYAATIRGAEGGDAFIVGDNVSTFMALDRLKRAIDPYAKKSAKKARDPQGAARLAEFDRQYEQIRSVLETEDLWGGAAKMQRQINAPWSDLFKQRREFERALTNPVRGKWGVIEGAEVDRDKVAGFFRRMLDEDATSTGDATLDYLGRLESFADASREALDMSPADRIAVQEMAEGIQRLRTHVEAGAEAGRARRLLASVERADSTLSLTTAGAVVGGAGGAVLGRAADIVLRPGGTVRQLAAMHGLVRAGERRLTDAVGDLRELGSVPAARTAVTRGVTKADQATRDRYEAAATAVRTEEALADGVAGELGEVALGAPETTSAAVEHSRSVQAYLRAMMPEMPPTAGEMSGLVEPPPVPTAQQRDYLRVVDAVSDPPAVYERLASGEVSYLEMDAIRQSYPQLYDRMRYQIAEQLRAMHDSGERPEYGTRVRLGLMLDLPTDGMLELGVMLPPQAAAPPPPPPTTSAKPMDMDIPRRTGPEERAMLDNGA